MAAGLKSVPDQKSVKYDPTGSMPLLLLTVVKISFQTSAEKVSLLLCLQLLKHVGLERWNQSMSGEVGL